MANDPRIPTKQFLESIGLQPHERYLPGSLDESHTILEKLNRMGFHVNESNKLSKEVISKWNEFSQWYNNEFDEDVQEKIRKELTDQRIISLTKPTITSTVINQVSGIEINVKQFGATGDGVTDDTQAIRNAINSLKEGDKLRFPNPSKYYKVSLTDGDIFVLTKKNITLYSDVINGIFLPIIKVEGSTPQPESSLFKIKENGISLKGISASLGDVNNRLVGYGVSTDAIFRPSLTMESVHILYPITAGFNLITYMSTLDRCQVRFASNEGKNGTGFQIKGDVTGLEGTMIDMRGCYSDYCDKGFYMENILYSGISSCGADHITEISYDLYKCKTITFSGIGSEAQLKSTLHMRECIGVTVNGLKLVEDPNRNKNLYAITLDGCTNCKITAPQVGNTGNFVQILYGNGNEVETPNVFRNGVAYFSNYGTKRVPQHKLIPKTHYQTIEQITQEDFYNSLVFGIDSSTLTDRRQIFQHVYFEDDYILNLLLTPGYGIKSGGSQKVLKGLKGNRTIRFIGNDTNKNLNTLDVGTNSNFKILDNTVEIVFENITFYSSGGTTSMFTIKNSKLRFKNCVFRMTQTNGSFKVSNLFNAENSTIVIESDTQLVDNPINKYLIGDGNKVIFLNPSGSLPKFYQFENPTPTNGNDLYKTVLNTGNKTTIRKPITAYTIGDIVLIDRNLYRCNKSGVTGTETPSETNSTITDGDVTWTFISISPLKNFVENGVYTIDDYILIEGNGIWKITTGGTVTTINKPITEIGSTATLSPSGITGLKGANSIIETY